MPESVVIPNCLSYLFPVTTWRKISFFCSVFSLPSLHCYKNKIFGSHREGSKINPHTLDLQPSILELPVSLPIIKLKALTQSYFCAKGFKKGLSVIPTLAIIIITHFMSLVIFKQ